MTIDSSWLVAFKEEIPDAFVKSMPFRPAAVFVDGQIRLMQGSSPEPLTWDQYIFRQFARPLSRFLESSDVVILAFDNYAHVPKAKCMTQLKRRRGVPVQPFSDHSELPCMVPESARWAQCIANRTFKTRVIDLVLLRLPSMLLTGRPGKRLVVDYLGPVEYECLPDRSIRRTPIDELEELGEADVKFTRYADRYGRLMVDSIDGDSIPIALMHHELCLRQEKPVPQIAVYRMELRSPDQPPAKRKSKDEKQRRAYEFVNIHMLYIGLRQVVAQSSGRIVMPQHVGHEMAMLIALISLSGTDFSRNLPLISGKTIYSYLPTLWPTLVYAFDPESDQLKVPLALDLLVPLLYRSKFCGHVRVRSGMRAVLDELLASKLSQRSKDLFPSAERVECTLRNANWVLSYWTCQPYPDPLQACYGFRLGRGGPEYAE